MGLPGSWERQLVNPQWGVQGSGKLGKTLGEQPRHSLTQGKVSSLAGLQATWTHATSPSLDNPTRRSAFLPSVLGLETPEVSIAPVVLDGVGNAIPKARDQGVVAGTATWGLFDVVLGSLGECQCPTSAPGVLSECGEEGPVLCP